MVERTGREQIQAYVFFAPCFAVGNANIEASKIKAYDSSKKRSEK